MSTHAVSIANVSKSFGAHRAVDQLSLTIDAGERFFVIGPSGCGKTTLLRLLAGLERPDAGEIRIFDQLAAGQRTMLPPAARQVSLVFQNFALWPHMTVMGHLRFAGGKRAEVEWITQVIAMTRIGGLEAKFPAMLSGGEQQRLALARALVTRPRLLLLDEPLRNLDPVLAGELRREMDELFRRLGMTVIYVTHDQREALELGQRMMIMRTGRIDDVGVPAELTRAPQSAFAAHFLGHLNVFEAAVANGVIDCPAARLETSLPHGTTALVCIQPADIKLQHADGAWRVTRVFARADQTLVELEDPHKTLLTAALVNGVAATPGDRMAVRVDRATIRATARGGQ